MIVLYFYIINILFFTISVCVLFIVFNFRFVFVAFEDCKTGILLDYYD